MQKWLVRLSGLGALLISIPVMYRIHEGDRFNPVSYFLWSSLALICTITLIRAKKGGYMLMGGYVLSDASVGTYAYFHGGSSSLGKFEWFITALVMICAALYVWCESRKNFKPAVIINGTACIIAGIPVIADSFQNPHQMSLVICYLYLLISAMAYYGERSFNGKFIPGLSIGYWILIIGGIAILRLI